MHTVGRKRPVTVFWIADFAGPVRAGGAAMWSGRVPHGLPRSADRAPRVRGGTMCRTPLGPSSFGRCAGDRGGAGCTAATAASVISSLDSSRIGDRIRPVWNTDHRRPSRPPHGAAGGEPTCDAVRDWVHQECRVWRPVTFVDIWC